MARIPTYDAPQVGPAALPNVGFNLDTSAIARGDKALGQGLQQVGGEAQDLINQAQQKQNAVDVTNRLTALSAAANKAHYGTGVENSPGAVADDPSVSGMSRALGAAAAVDATGADAGASAGAAGVKQTAGTAPDADSGLSPNGLLNERGVNAFKYAGPSENYITGVREQLIKGLNPVAAQEFQQRSDQMLNDYSRQANEHVAQQHLVVDQAALHAATAQALNDVANNYANPAAIESRLAALEPSIEKLAVSPEDAKAQVAAVRQKAYETSLNQYIANGDWSGAQSYFAAKKSELGDEGVTFQKQITVLRDKSIGDQTGRGFVMGAQDPKSGLVDVTKAIANHLNDAEANKGKRTPDQQEAIDTAFRSSLGQGQESNRAMASNMLTEAGSQWEKNHNLNDIDTAHQQWLKNNDFQAWEALRKQDQEYHSSLARGSKQKVSRDALLNYNSWMAGADKDPTKLQKLTLAQIHHDCFAPDGTRRVTDEQEQKMMDRWRQANGQKPLDYKALTPELSHLATTAADGVPGLSKLDKARVRDRLDSVLVEKVAAWKSAHSGANPDPDYALKTWLAPELAKGSVKGGGFFGYFDTDATRVEAESNPKFQGKEFVPETAPASAAGGSGGGGDEPPDNEKAAISAQFRARYGKDPTDEQLSTIYARHRTPKAARSQPQPSSRPSATQASLVSPVSRNLFNGGEDPPEEKHLGIESSSGGGGQDVFAGQSDAEYRAAIAKAKAEKEAADKEANKGDAADKSAAAAKKKARAEAEAERAKIASDNEAARRQSLLTVPTDDYQGT